MGPTKGKFLTEVVRVSILIVVVYYLKAERKGIKEERMRASEEMMTMMVQMRWRFLVSFILA